MTTATHTNCHDIRTVPDMMDDLASHTGISARRRHTSHKASCKPFHAHSKRRLSQTTQ